MYYDIDGKQIEMMEWVTLFKNFDYRVIKQETLPDGKWVSTVWLGLDHSFNSKEPLIFETMVFPKKDDYKNLDMDRYSTLEKAIKGHEEMVKKYEPTPKNS